MEGGPKMAGGHRPKYLGGPILPNRGHPVGPPRGPHFNPNREKRALISGVIESARRGDAELA